MNIVFRYSNHELLCSQNKNIINQYDSLIISGNCMFHLTLNSLLKNNVKIPLGIIPTGLNGLMKSIFYERVKDKYTDADCYNLIKE